MLSDFLDVGASGGGRIRHAAIISKSATSWANCRRSRSDVHLRPLSPSVIRFAYSWQRSDSSNALHSRKRLTGRLIIVPIAVYTDSMVSIPARRKDESAPMEIIRQVQKK